MPEKVVACLEFGNREAILSQKRSLLLALYDERFACQQKATSLLKEPFDPKGIRASIPEKNRVKWDQVLEKMKEIDGKIYQVIGEIQKIRSEMDHVLPKTTS